MRPVGEDGRPRSALSKLLSAEERKDKYVVQSTGRPSWSFVAARSVLDVAFVGSCVLLFFANSLSAGVRHFATKVS